ncbi:MAG TPA: aromatic ring-hydroxylating dioxygenase subunit alpha [Gaiellaceae bacterium]|nr:aromatic ring-hydroxylating dioxygenase subunit alpha [Gaiellaceae bacterium]
METTETVNGLPPVPRPLADGWTLPASWYSDETVFQREQKWIFSSAWQYAGPAELVSEPGSFLTSVAGHIPVVVTRAQDGELRGLVNVCRHRGHVVAQGAGCRATLQCPYHAWTYELDGTLRRAPRSEREPGFDASGLSLLPVSIDTWGPFVFVNPDPDAPPLFEALGNLPETVARSGLDLDSLRFHSHVPWEQPVNWKVALENYLECYHCPTAHPGFSKVIDVDPDSYRLSVEGLVSSQTGPLREEAADGDMRQSQYHFVWPNTTINISPGPQNVSIERWVPLGPRATVEATDYFFGEGVPAERIEESIAFDTQVATEDVALVESVQRGLDSRTVVQGRLMPESEQLVAAFQRRVHDTLVD